MKRFVCSAFVGLAASAGALVPTAAHAAPLNLRDRIAVCSARYDARVAGATDAFDRCIDNAIATSEARNPVDATVNAGTLGTASDGGVNTAVLGTASDGGVNTGILGMACGDGSFNSGILGNAGC